MTHRLLSSSQSESADTLHQGLVAATQPELQRHQQPFGPAAPAEAYRAATTPKPPGLSMPICVATLCNAVMGVGILALPRAVADVGLVLGVALMLCVAALSLLTLLLLAESIRWWKARTYAQLINRAIGPNAARVCAVIVTINLFGACVGANIAMATTFDDLLNRANLLDLDDRTGEAKQLLANTSLRLPSLNNRQLWIVMLGAGLVLPLSLRGTFRALGPASLLSTISAAFLALVACGFLVAAALPDGHGIPCSTCPPLQMGHWGAEVLDSTSVFMFAFVTHSILPQVLCELENPTEQRVRTTLTTTVVFVSVVYLLVAVAGYLQFSSDVCGTITESFETVGRNDAPSNETSQPWSTDRLMSTWVTVSQLLVVLSLGAGFPTALWPCRDAICFLLVSGSVVGSPKLMQESPTLRACVCVAVWAASCAAALAVAASGEHRLQLDDVLELVGATVSSIVAFVLPFMCFTQLRHGIDRGTQVPLPIGRRILTTLPGWLSMAGIVLAVCATYVVVRNNYSEAATTAARDAREAVCERTAAAGDLPNDHNGST